MPKSQMLRLCLAEVCARVETRQLRQQDKAEREQRVRICTYVGLAAAFGSWGYAVINPRPNVYFGACLFLAALVCLLIPLWEGKIRAWLKVLVSVFVVATFIGGDYYWIIRKTWPPQDAPYLPPSSHKAIKVDGQIKPTPQACIGLSEEKEIECLCPRPVDYILNALPTPPDDNYATQVDIKAASEALYRVQLFGRTQMHSGTLEAFPYGDGKAATGVVEMDYDRYTLLVQSSAAQQEFKLEVRSSEGLRLKCINQIN